MITNAFLNDIKNRALSYQVNINYKLLICLVVYWSQVSVFEGVVAKLIEFLGSLLIFQENLAVFKLLKFAV